MIRAYGLAAIFAALALMGCSRSNPSENEERGLIDLYGAPGPEEILAREYLIEDRIWVCMKQRGFDYIRHEPHPVHGAHQWTVSSLFISTEQAREFGYFLTDAEVADIIAQSNIPTDTGGSADMDYLLNLDGLVGPDGAVEISGCRNEARDDGLHWTTTDVLPSIIPAVEEVVERLMADPRFIAIESEWAQCMHRRGYEATRMTEVWQMARSEVLGILGNPWDERRYDAALVAAARTAEQAIAEADAACLDPHRDTIAAITEEYERHMIEEYPSVLDVFDG